VPFTTQNVYLGKSINFDFTVSDWDNNYLHVSEDRNCPVFTTLIEQSTNNYRLNIYPPLNDFTLLGSKSCTVSLSDGTNSVSEILSINVLNSQPF
jgi:hypothetical protein